ncbi:hypothetical protein [Priestia megaterium]
MKETLKHKEAFEYYYSLGEKRTYQKVADQFDTSKTTVYKWSTNFGWIERVAQRDIDVAKKLEKKTNNTVADEKARYRTIIKGAIADFAKRLQDKEIVVDSVLDLERLVKLDLLLMGEPNERVEEKGETKHEYNIRQQIETDPESRELFKELYRRRMEQDRQLPRSD